MRVRRGRLTAALLATLALSACSDEPSAANMKQAMLSNVQLQIFARMAGQPLDQASVEKGDCTAATNALGFVCDFRMSLQVRGQTQTGDWKKARFFKAGDGWNVENSR